MRFIISIASSNLYQATINGNEDVEAHCKVEARLAMGNTVLKGPGSSNDVVEGLGKVIAGGNGVTSELEKERDKIWVVKGGI